MVSISDTLSALHQAGFTFTPLGMSANALNTYARFLSWFRETPRFVSLLERRWRGDISSAELRAEARILRHELLADFLTQHS